MINVLVQTGHLPAKLSRHVMGEKNSNDRIKPRLLLLHRST